MLVFVKETFLSFGEVGAEILSTQTVIKTWNNLSSGRGGTASPLFLCIR